jgi:NAD(P)-dependent dehydrogenase (short-subunit alcohol dehydrogenase family)
MTLSERREDVVVITGGSAGLGRAIADRFATSGARLAIIARGRARLEQAKSELEARGAKVLIFSDDVADPDAMERVAEAVEGQLGPIDIWINNAMVSVFSPIKQMEPAEYRRVTEVTYLGYVYGTLAALRRMLPRNRGVIIHVGSALAHRSIPLQSAYCAAKHAVMGFHESLLSELLHDGSAVRTTIVQMPALNTPQFDWVKTRLPNSPQPLPPVFQPEIGADAVFFAAYHDVGRELLVGWPTVKVVEGNKILAGYIDRKLARDGYKGQQGDSPVPPGRQDNLWKPAPGDWRAHGRFDDIARPKSLQLRMRLQLQLLEETLGRFFRPWHTR